MKLMKTEDAVGQVLCHDITQIIKGVTKDAVFRKGHIITEEDIPVLLSVGKDNIYIWEKDDTMLHENEAAQILYDMCKNDHMHPSDVKEGKIELIADCDGLLKVDREKLKKVNSLGEMMIATRHGDTYVKKGDKLAGTRIIPLVIKKEKMETAQAVRRHRKKRATAGFWNWTGKRITPRNSATTERFICSAAAIWPRNSFRCCIIWISAVSYSMTGRNMWTKHCFRTPGRPCWWILRNWTRFFRSGKMIIS